MRILPRPAAQRRAAFSVLAGTLALGVGALLPAAAATGPVGTAKTLSKNVATSALTDVEPIASTTNTSEFGVPYAVYARHNVVHRMTDVSGRLVAVPKGRSPKAFGVITPDMTDFSLSGYTLTARSMSDPSTVYFWRPSAGPHGAYETGTLGANDRYLGSAPDGWVELGSDGTLYAVNASVGESSARPMGDPFGSATDVRAVSGPTGIVVTNQTSISFVPFNGGPITPLDTSQSIATFPWCTSVSAVAVACNSYLDTGEDDSGFKNIFIDPLDGAPAYAASTACPTQGAMVGANAGWMSCKGRLAIIGEHAPSAPTVTLRESPVAGLGGYLTIGESGHTGTRISAGGKTVTTILPATHATSEATRFALARHSLTWAENDSSHAYITIHRRSVRSNSFDTAVTAGKIHAVGTSKVSRGSIAAAGSSYIYATNYVNAIVGQNGGETLRVVTPSRTVTINEVDRYMRVSIADHRVLYFSDGTHARLYNLKTDKTTRFDATGAALSGHELAYCGTDGVVRLKNLETGSVRQVAIGAHLNQAEIYVRGQRVGWNTWDGHYASYSRDMSKQIVPVQLPSNESIWALTDAGMTLETLTNPDEGSTPFFPVESQLRYYTVDFLLQPYDSGTATELVHADHLSAGPQIATGVVAWIDQHGKLTAQPLEQ